MAQGSGNGRTASAGMPSDSFAGFLLFLGCTGKSAQIPLRDVAPGRDGRSHSGFRVIHAATMVTAGVYLVVRLSPLFAILPEVPMTITVIGPSPPLGGDRGTFPERHQEGPRLFGRFPARLYVHGRGVAAFDASIFHVFTHAFFKAVFLGAGAVITCRG